MIPPTAPPPTPTTVCESKAFRGVAASVPAARRFAVGLLPEDDPRRDDLATLLSEVAANAIRHTASAGADCVFTVIIAIGPDVLRAILRDAGGATVPCFRRPSMRAEGQESEEAGLKENGRGMGMVDQLAYRWGFQRNPDGTTDVWFDLQTV